MSKKHRKQGEDGSDWQRIRDSLDAFQPERLAEELRRFLSSRIPRDATHIPENQRFALFQEVSALVSNTVGPWCQLSGSFLGNPVIGGYVSSYFFKGKAPLRGPGMELERNIQAIVQAIQKSQRWLRRLDEYFRSVTLPEDEQDLQLALTIAVHETLDIVIEETGCEDAWYGYAFDAVRWLMESLGLYMTDNMKRTFTKALGSYESWVSPSKEDTERASEALALEVVRKNFAQKYPK
ncbi:hypothetical protein [Hyalangium rubrum]|uniref:Uncharacterized protein n=1 Tax=Hyalangium rubrum TaxID=3103134 RepID=A0ABU5H9E3_9BACT|nr:hypothetical protein [Hyalangium sp. s54d21]MDY7229392.1 hypothetical protein [Hyalangium sp. s54d21]